MSVRAALGIVVAGCGQAPVPVPVRPAPANEIVLAAAGDVVVVQLRRDPDRFDLVVRAPRCRAAACSTVLAPGASPVRAGVVASLLPGITEVVLYSASSTALAASATEVHYLVRPGSPPSVLCGYVGPGQGDAEGRRWTHAVDVIAAGPSELVVTTRSAAWYGCSETVSHLVIAADGSCSRRDEPPIDPPPLCILP